MEIHSCTTYGTNNSRSNITRRLRHVYLQHQINKLVNFKGSGKSSEKNSATVTTSELDAKPLSEPPGDDGFRRACFVIVEEAAFKSDADRV